MFKRRVSRDFCTTLYIVHAVYCWGQRQGTWMLFLSERWRGESLLRSYTVCVVHSFWPMANVNPYVCKRHALKQILATKNARGNACKMSSEKQNRTASLVVVPANTQTLHVQHKYCINCNLMFFKRNMRWRQRDIQIKLTKLLCNSCREDTIVRPRHRWNKKDLNDKTRSRKEYRITTDQIWRTIHSNTQV